MPRHTYFHVDETALAEPATGEAIAGSWWAREPGRGLLFWMDLAQTCMSVDFKPICNASENAARMLLPHLGRPDAELVQVPVVFMAIARREAIARLETHRTEARRIKAETQQPPPRIGSPEWDALVSAGGGGGSRGDEIRGILAEMGRRHADRGEPESVEMDGRLGLMSDGRLRSLLTPRDWRLYHATRDCRDAAAALNAGLEAAFAEGEEPFAALEGLRETYRSVGADDTDSREAAHAISARLAGWRAVGPGPA